MTVAKQVDAGIFPWESPLICWTINILVIGLTHNLKQKGAHKHLEAGPIYLIMYDGFPLIVCVVLLHKLILLPS